MTRVLAHTPGPEAARAFAARMPDGHALDSDEPQMETTLHQRALVMLQTTLDWHWRERNDYFIGANLSVYYDLDELRRRRFFGPDFFLVRGCSPHPRRSWVVWQEGGRYPDLIVELLSERTAHIDRGAKRTHYQNIFRTPEYFWFDPLSLEFEGFRLGATRVYEPIAPDAAGRRFSEVMDLALGVEDDELHLYDPAGRRLPSPAEAALAGMEEATAERERADAEQVRAETERQRAEAEHRRAEALAARLRALGIDPETAA